MAIVRPRSRLDAGELARLASVVTLVVILLAGAAIRVHGWWRAPSFWVDELRLAVNVAERPLPGLLTEPLRYGYLVPPAYLAVERMAFRVLGRDERGLRFPALLASLLALAATPALARRVLGSGIAPLPVALMAFAAPLVAFANDARPYAVDLACGVLLPLLGLRWLERADRARGAALVAGFAVAPLVSFGALLGGAGALAGLALGAFEARARERRTVLALSVALFLLAAAVSVGSVWHAYRDDAALRAGLAEYWTATGGFPGPAGGAVTVATWLAGRVVAFARFPLAPWLASWPAVAVGLLVAAGGWALFVARRQAFWILGGALAAGLLAGSLRWYPFAARLTLFLAPAAALCVSAILLPLALRPRRLGPVLAAAIALSASLAAGWEAWRRERGFELQSGRALVAALAARVQPEDRIYVGYAGEPAWRFYAPAFGLEPQRAAIGRCAAPDPFGELPLEPPAPAGTHIWLLFSATERAERSWLVDRLATCAHASEVVDLTRGRPRLETLELMEVDTGATCSPEAGRGGPGPPDSSRWRCVFFDRG